MQESEKKCKKMHFFAHVLNRGGRREFLDRISTNFRKRISHEKAQKLTTDYSDFTEKDWPQRPLPASAGTGEDGRDGNQDIRGSGCGYQSTGHLTVDIRVSGCWTSGEQGFRYEKDCLSKKKREQLECIGICISHEKAQKIQNRY